MKRLLLCICLLASLAFAVPTTPLPDTRTIRVVLFDGIDRNSTASWIDPTGLDLSDFYKNPVLLLQHRVEPEYVLGKVTNLVRVDDHWEATLYFLPRPPGWEGNWIPDLYLTELREGILGVSVHVDDLVIRDATPADKALYGLSCESVVEHCRLLDLSVVVLPAFADAVPITRD